MCESVSVNIMCVCVCVCVAFSGCSFAWGRRLLQNTGTDTVSSMNILHMGNETTFDAYEEATICVFQGLAVPFSSPNFHTEHIIVDKNIVHLQ